MMKGNLAQQNISNLNAELRTRKAHGNQARRSQNRNRRGFTLPEVLLTVAILVVIFAVTVVGVSKFQQSLRQKELDSKAEIIYMAAQNRITELMASGRSDLYTPSEMDNTDSEYGTRYTSADSADDIQKLSVTPSDSDDNDTETLYFVTSATATEGSASTANYLLPEDRVDQELRENNWVIEFSPKDGNVYAVFYSEEENIQTEYQNEDNQKKYDDYRYKSERLDAGATIGYYGGDKVITLETTKLNPRIVVTNGEELYATITCNISGIDDLTYKITITDSFGNTETRTVNMLTGIMNNGKKKTYKLVLDNLETGKFAEGYPNLVPGSDLTIKCEASTTNKRVDKGEATTTEPVNSLYASVEFPQDSVDTSTSGTSKTGGVATITCGRHLQNLDTTTSGVNNTSNQKGVLTVTSAVQKNNIDFAEDKSQLENWYALYGTRQFTAINNELLTSYTGSYTDNEVVSKTSIHGLNAKGGLFDTFYGNTLKDITLTGTKITDGNSSNASGALCAQTAASGSLTITGCGVYLDENSKDLVNAKADSDGNIAKWLSGSKYVGGLIGHVQNTVTIENSFAATVAGNTTTDNTGGLVGYVASSSSVTINKSYADCYLYGKTVGGLIGGGTSGATVNVSNSYAVGFATASEGGAGFYPGTIKDASTSYSAMSFDGNAAGQNGNVCAIAKNYTGTTSKLYYVPFKGISSHIDDRETNTASSSMSGKSKEGFIKNYLDESVFSASTTASPYNLKDNGLTQDYSYPGLKDMINYGDWESFFEEGSLVYYEQYGTSDYGIYGASTQTIKNTTPIGDGYGIAYDAQPSEVTVTYTNKDGNDTTARASEYFETKNSKGKTIYILKLPKKVVNTGYAAEDFYQKIEFNESTWYYNPHFAKTQTQIAPNAQTSISTVYVRTARQLYSMSLYYGTYADKTKKATYTQELDIDYTTYNWTNYYGSSSVTSQSPIGSGSGLTFSSTYDGGSHTIYGVSFVNTSKSSYYAGMFGDNKGTLKNIFVVWDYTGDDTADKTVELDATISGSTTKAYIGTLAGKNSKSITNCGVCGYYIKCRTFNSSTSYIGGLVGQNNGSITSSYADVPKIAVEPTSSTVKIGGFVGKNENMIRTCYASGYTKITGAKEGSVDVGGFFGENTGNIRYAYCTNAVELAGVAQGYGFGPRGGYTNTCYYLANGTYTYVGNLKLYEQTDANNGVEAISAKNLKKNENLNLTGFGATEAEKQYANMTEDQENEKFPYPAVATNAAGKTVHYGNWVQKAELGGVGVFYWEKEESGSNNGYHISYIGVTSTGATKEFSSLCDSHNDGGIISEYGYGYYVQKDDENKEIGTVTLTTIGFDAFDTNSTTNRKVNEKAKAALQRQLDGFSIYAYTTADTSVKGTTNLQGYLYLEEKYANGTWTLNYTKDGNTTKYNFTVCPFFANSFSYNGAGNETSSSSTTPGTESNQYQVRSRDQLQYINWNSYAQTRNATSALTGKDDSDCQYFTYLSYLNSRGTYDKWTKETTYTYYKAERKVYYWLQSHDVDNNDVNKNKRNFTPVGSMFYSSDDNKGDADIAGFTGTYDGGEYMIKNLRISVDTQMVGLFGITVGADLSNIFIYSDQEDNVIENKAGDSTNSSSAAYNYKWYCIGGLVGFAAEGKDVKDASITNCSVAGYTINDNRSTNGGWGGASIGGLAGACNMTIERCSAVNDIKINVSYASTSGDGCKNIRVGGLIGNLRGTVDSCYSGGSITGTEKAKKNSSSRKSDGYYSNESTYKNRSETSLGESYPSIWAGGINGGIVMVNYGVADIIGSTTSQVTVKNSYSYVKMPPSGYRLVKCSQSIASIGEMQTTETVFAAVPEPNLTIENCYAYTPNVEDTDDYTKYKNRTNWTQKLNIHQGNASNHYLYLDNSGNSPYVTYAQLSAASGTTDAVIDLLNNKITDANKKFTFVTVTENGTRIDGKYSFSAGDTDLEGDNYPFPTILKQTDTLSNKVSVHYGKWPKGDIYWNGVTATIDLLDDYNDSLGGGKLTWKLTSNSKPSFKYLNESREELDLGANNVSENSITSNNDGTYDVIIKAIREGTEIIRAYIEGGSSDLKVQVTAKMNLTATPDRVELKKKADDKLDVPQTIVLNATTQKGTSLTSETTPTWDVTIDDENVAAIVTDSLKYDSDNKAWVVQVIPKNEGTTSLHATASYNKTIGSENRTFTDELIITIEVEDE